MNRRHIPTETARAMVFEATIADLRAALEDGRVTSTALVAACMARIAAFDRAGPCLSSIPVLNPGMWDEARASDARRAEGAPLVLDADALFWAREVENPLAGTALADQPGILFPVAQENGRAGIVAFYGAAPALDTGALCEAHAACLALFVEVARQRPLAGAALPSMSKREIECLRLTANGFTSDEIAAALGLSVHTANQYLTSSAHKLNAVNRIHAVAKALRAGLID